ncbi:MAG: amidohydrolase [Bdellovibrionales bacterium]|nr:amidohydrolase [Bdellovibrionales bacterium]
MSRDPFEEKKKHFDLWIHGGTLVSMDPSRSIYESAGLGVIDGRIVYVGPQQNAEYQSAKTTIDAKGKWILPGLINGHSHVAMTLFRGLADDRMLMDWLQHFIWPAEAKHADENFVYTGSLLGCMEMMAAGITCFADMFFHAHSVARAIDHTGMRAISGQNLIDFPTPDNPKGWDEGLELAREFHDHWKDHRRITPGLAPHSPYAVSPEHLIQAHQLSQELQAPFLIHVAEPETEVQQIQENFGKKANSVIEYLYDIGILDSRMIAAHVIWTPGVKDLERLEHAQVGVVHCPHSNMKLASGTARIPAMIKQGIAVGLGTDGAASNNDLSLWEEMDLAAKLHKLIEKDPTVMPAQSVFEMATIEGARSISMQHEIGSLEVGKKADVILVDRDTPHQMPCYNPYSQLVYATKSSDVSTVIVDGEVVYRDRNFLQVDKSKVFSDVETYRSLLAQDLS